ncbi:MAG: RagB/SusD family nutrient uptake outer membrane protein [Chitinophagaceae bacterium]
MKKSYFNIPVTIAAMAVLSMGVSSCKKSFFDGVPADQYTDGNFYNNATQVGLATAAMYGKPWFYFNCQYNMGIGDTYAGNSKGDADADMTQFENMSITQSNGYIYKGWQSMFYVVAVANSVITNVQANASKLDATTINTAIGEARFMRAAAYFNLVRLYGAVPIIEDMTKNVSNYQLPRNIVTDVYRFIIEDLKYAEANLPVKGATAARVKIASAKALLAKVYLTQKDYTNAAAKALEVINNETAYGIGLMDSYADLFYTKNNNNKESLFALQWVASNVDGSYGTGNVTQAYCAAYGQGLTGLSDGWGSFRPTLDLQSAFETGDLRRKPTYMLKDDVYPELKQASGGYTYPGNNLSTTNASVKKYVVGTYEDNSSVGGVYFMSTGINTYMIRYSDVLLTYAEAVLGSNASTSDVNALKQFNRVRKRAGLGDKSSIGILDILHERRVEFAFEGQYWYDLLRLPQAQAISIIANQERGRINSSNVITSLKVTPTAANFVMPIPQIDLDNDPKLSQDPVPYY